VTPRSFIRMEQCGRTSQDRYLTFKAKPCWVIRPAVILTPMAAIFHRYPHPGIALASGGAHFERAERADKRLFEAAQVVPDSRSESCKVNDRVPHELTRAVKGYIAASVGVDDGCAAAYKILSATSMLASPPRRPRVYVGGCSSRRRVSGPPAAATSVTFSEVPGAHVINEAKPAEAADFDFRTDFGLRHSSFAQAKCLDHESGEGMAEDFTFSAEGYVSSFRGRLPRLLLPLPKGSDEGGSRVRDLPRAHPFRSPGRLRRSSRPRPFRRSRHRALVRYRGQ